MNIEAGFGTDAENMLLGLSGESLDFVLDWWEVYIKEVDFIENGNDGEIGEEGELVVADGLGLDSLLGVDQQDGPFAREHAATHLVLEVHVARRVDQLQQVLSIVHSVKHTARLRFHC